MRWTKFFILPVVLLTACINSIRNDLNKIGSPYWEPEWGLPVLSGEFSLGDYLDAVADVVTVSEDENGVIVITYTGPEIASDKAEDMMTIPDQSFSAAISFAAGEVSGLPVALTISKTSTFDFTVTTELSDVIDSLILKNGMLNIDINGDFPASGEVAVVFNPIRLNGSTFSRTYSWTYDPANPGQSFTENIDLSDAFIDFTNNQTTTNNFSFTVTLTINYEGQPITEGNAVNINLAMANPRFRLVFGKFSQRDFTTPKESVLIGILENVAATDFFLDNPQIDLNFKSSFGLPVSARLNSLVAFNNNGDSLAFTGPVITNATAVGSPDINQIGSFVETAVQINRDNSNITDIISFLPTTLNFQFSGSVEPAGPQVEQFVLDTSRVIGSYNVKLPLSGYVSGFDSQQEFDFDGANLDPLKKPKIIVHSVNGLPLTVAVALVFLDNNNQPLDTLFSENNLLGSGSLDAEGFVVAPAENFVEETLTAEQLQKLAATKKIVLKSTLFTGTSGTESVKIRSADKVKISVFVQSTFAN